MRVRSADGEWTVDVISLSLTGNQRDGEWFRVSRCGWFVAELRSVCELAALVNISELAEAWE
jgi:hypothetical protein